MDIYKSDQVMNESPVFQQQESEEDLLNKSFSMNQEEFLQNYQSEELNEDLNKSFSMNQKEFLKTQQTENQEEQEPEFETYIKRDFKTITYSGKKGYEGNAFAIKHSNTVLNKYISKNYPPKSLDEAANEYVKCHENRTRVLAHTYSTDSKDPAQIVKISLAGTGFDGWRRQNKGMKIKEGEIYKQNIGKIVVDDGRTMERTKEGFSIKTMQGETSTVKKVGFWGKVSRFGSWLYGKITGNMDTYNKKLEDLNKYKEAKKAFEKAVEEKKDFLYGEGNQKVGNKTLKYVRKKEVRDNLKGTKVEKISMAGSLGVLGTNFGNYSMQGQVENIEAMYKPRIQQWVNDHADKEGAVPPLHFLIEGHSRGAVAANVAVGKLVAYTQELTKDLANKDAIMNALHFETVSLDPVYGLTSGWGEYGEMDMKKQTKAIGANCQSTVVYDINSNYNVAFAPQTVTGCDRVILTPFKHTTGTSDVSQVELKNGQKEDMAGLFTDYKTGEAYKAASLNELEKGLYIMNENRELIKIKDAKDAKDIVKEMLNGKGSIRQMARHNTIYKVIDDFFTPREQDKDNVKK